MFYYRNFALIEVVQLSFDGSAVTVIVCDRLRYG